jgi:hypothetical protein
MTRTRILVLALVAGPVLLAVAVSGCNLSDRVPGDACDPLEHTQQNLPVPPSGRCPSRADALRAFASQEQGLISVDSDGMIEHIPAWFTCCYEVSWPGVSGTKSTCVSGNASALGVPDASICPPATDPSLQYDVTSLEGSDATIVGGPVVHEEQPAHDACVYDVTTEEQLTCDAVHPL